jgi:hypothetical protein
MTADTSTMVGKIVVLHTALDDARLPHAFGGALALAWCTERARGTIDIDVNVFVPAAQAERVLDALAPLGVERPAASRLRDLRERGQVRLRWEHTPLDLFFSYDPLHERCAARARTVPFGEGATLAILAAEDLAIFKVIFDRPKDWTDLAEMLFAQGASFDADYARDWLRRILPRDDERLARFEALLP